MAETIQRSSPDSSISSRISYGTGWEYRVQTIGSVFGTKDENIEATLNEWGEDG